MKKLLLLLLCVPLIFSCGENNEKKNDTEDKIENTCDVTPDYFMTDDEFMKAVEDENNVKKYDGKIFELSVNYTNRCFSFHNNNIGSMNFTIIEVKPKITFGENGMEIDMPSNPCGGHINFQYVFNNEQEDEYEQKLSDEKKGHNDKGVDIDYNPQERIIKIKGKYIAEESELIRDGNELGKYVLKEGCFIIQPFENYNN